jgi:hypothetical protein
MIEKNYTISGVISIGGYKRLILPPIDPAKKKGFINFGQMAAVTDPSELQQQLMIESIIAGNPPSILVNQMEYHTEGTLIDQKIRITIEVVKK